MEAPELRNDPILAEIVRRLVEAYQPERVYLFGSHARGEAGPDSDYDLMLVVPDEAPASFRQSSRAYEVLGGSAAGERPPTCWFGHGQSLTSVYTLERRYRQPSCAKGGYSMALDPVRIADTRAWLTKVQNDLRGAEIDLAAVPPLLEDLAFHCQQAVEKPLKAYLTWHDEPFRKTHDSDEVGKQCAVLDPTLAPLVRRATPLTEYAWRFRYPGGAPTLTLEAANDALALAREVVEAVLARLPIEVTH